MERKTKAKPKDTLFDELARIGKALSSGRRLELIEILSQGGRTVEDLAQESRLTIANTSQHLQVLKAAHLVESTRDGSHVRYRLTSNKVADLWLSLRAAGEAELAEVDRLLHTFFTNRSALEAIGVGELKSLVAEGSVTVLDVRSRLEFEAGHIGGARSIPVTELKARLKEIPKKKLIVAYCRGRYCVYAGEAVALLKQSGFRAIRLEAGVLEWRASGGEVLSSAGA